MSERDSAAKTCSWCDGALALWALLGAALPARMGWWWFAVLLLFVLVRWWRTGWVWTRTPIDAPLALLGVLGLASRFFTALPAVSHDPFIYLVSGVAMLVAVGGWSITPRRVSMALVALGAAGVGLIALSPLVGLPVSTTIHPNILAGALAPLAPMALAVALRRGQDKPGMRMAAGLLGLVLCAAIISTRSRGACLGVAAGVGLVCVWRERRLLWTLPLAGMAVAVLGWQVGWPKLVDWLVASGATTNLAGRLEIWRRALYMWRDFPLTGVGLGCFNAAVRTLYPFYSIGPNAAVPHAHNLVLQVGVDLGVLGMAAFVVMWLKLASMALAAARRGPDWLRPLAVGLLGSYATIFVHGLLDASTWGTAPAILMWAWFGLAVGIWRMMKAAVAGQGNGAAL